MLVVERAEQVGERFDAPAAERRHHREEQAMRGDRAQALGLTGGAPELIDSVDGQRPPQDVTQVSSVVDKVGNGSLLCWLVSQPQHEAVVVPCRSPTCTATDCSNCPRGRPLKILPMRSA